MNTALITTILPVILLLIHAYRIDKYMKEPIEALFLSFLAGMTAYPISWVFMIALGCFFPDGADEDSFWQLPFYLCLISLPATLAKLCTLWFVKTKNHHFNEHIDGIVYSIVISLGFGMLQSLFLQVINEDSTASIAMLSVTSVPLNWFLGVLMGYYFSMSLFGRKKKIKYMMLAAVVPMVLHSIFYIFFTAIPSISPMYEGIVFVGLIVLCYVAWKIANKKINKLLKRDKETFDFADDNEEEDDENHKTL